MASPSAEGGGGGADRGAGAPGSRSRTPLGRSWAAVWRLRARTAWRRPGTGLGGDPAPGPQVNAERLGLGGSLPVRPGWMAMAWRQRLLHRRPHWGSTPLTARTDFTADGERTASGVSASSASGRATGEATTPLARALRGVPEVGASARRAPLGAGVVVPADAAAFGTVSFDPRVDSLPLRPGPVVGSAAASQQSVGRSTSLPSSPSSAARSAGSAAMPAGSAGASSMASSTPTSRSMPGPGSLARSHTGRPGRPSAPGRRLASAAGGTSAGTASRSRSGLPHDVAPGQGARAAAQPSDAAAGRSPLTHLPGPGPLIRGTGVEQLSVGATGANVRVSGADVADAYRATPGHRSPLAPAPAPALARQAEATPASPGAPAGPVRSIGRASEGWSAAIRRQPLETPQAFPGAWASWASRMSGRTAVRWTAGEATSGALRAAGARAATSGDVVHLPVAPRWGAAPTVPDGDDSRGSTSAGPRGRGDDLVHLLAHELGHLREPLTRPRFLLSDPHAAGDADEHRAHRFAADVTRFPSIGGRGLPQVPRGLGDIGNAGNVAAGVVDSLPVAGPVAAAAAGARQAVAELTDGAVDRVSEQVTQQVHERVTGAVHEVLQSLPGPAGQALSAALNGSPGGLAQGLAGAAQSVAAGQGFDLSAISGGLQQAQGAAMGAAQGALGAATDAAGAALGSVTGAVGAAAGNAAGTASSALAALTGAGHGLTHLPHETVDRIVEALEQRILSEIERRGGRYAGSF